MVGNADLTCEEANIRYVKITVSTHGLDVLKNTIYCGDLNTSDISKNDSINPNGYLVDKIWADENYDVKVEFVAQFYDDVYVVKNLTVIPKISPVSEPTDIEEQSVLVEKAARANMKVFWIIDDAIHDPFTGPESCESLHVENFKIAFEADVDLCDGSDCVFSDFISLPCSSVWTYDYVIKQARNTNLLIFAVDYRGKVLFSASKKVIITDAHLADGHVPNKTLRLEPLEVKK